MAGLRVRLFGKMAVRCNGHPLVTPSAQKVQEMFCYLLLNRDRTHSRETLAGLLWGDRSTAQSKKYLRQALWQLNAFLDVQTKPIAGRVLSVESDWIRLNPEADLWLDVAVFENTFALVKGVPGQELGAERVQSLKAAVRLYQGDLLAGWYQDWCLFERERLQNMYLAMLDKIMDSCEARSDYETGLAYGTRILYYERARERTHRRLMRLYHLAGDRTAALRQYDRCVAALNEELDVKPARRTVALFENIRADNLNGPTPTAAETNTATPQTVTSALPEVLARLEHLQTALADVQSQVQHEIRAIDLALNGWR